MADADLKKTDKRVTASAVLGSALVAATAILTGPLAIAGSILSEALLVRAIAVTFIPGITPAATGLAGG